MVLPDEFSFGSDFFGAFIQYPDAYGEVTDPTEFISKAHENNILVGVAADILSLVVLKAPGDCGADAVVGNTQRFGVPMGFGGPHAAYFATREEYKRNIPGRIIGVSVDSDGTTALRMALQTREQHIKRDKATSNICTAQALLAVMASMYAVYHGPNNLRNIAKKIHEKTASLVDALKSLGYEVINKNYFDTITLKVDAINDLRDSANTTGVNFFYHEDSDLVSISVDEVSSEDSLDQLIEVLGAHIGNPGSFQLTETQSINSELLRTDEILNAKVFNAHHSETKMMRYLKSLENKDLSLVHSMISLGSCTMKLNAASELIPLSWPEFANIHPFAPKTQVTGYTEILEELAADLCEITGFAGMSFATKFRCSRRICWFNGN